MHDIHVLKEHNETLYFVQLINDVKKEGQEEISMANRGFYVLRRASNVVQKKIKTLEVTRSDSSSYFNKLRITL